MPGSASTIHQALENPLRVQYSNSYDEEQCHLIDLPQEVITELQDGGVVRLKADPKGVLSMTTESNTYELKFLDSSNLRLLTTIKESQNLGTAMSALSSDVAVRKVEPDLSCLSRYCNVLRENCMDSNDTNSGQTIQEVFQEIPASELEIRTAMKRIQAFEWQGKLFVFESKFKNSMLNIILDAVDAGHWTLERIDVEHVLKFLQKTGFSVDLVIVRELLGLVGTQSLDEVGVYNISARFAAIFRAEEILLTQHEKQPLGMIYEHFMEAWEASCNDCVDPDPELLADLAVIYTTAGHQKVIKYLPASRLPTDPKARMDALFSEVQKWPATEFEKFMIKLFGSKEELEDFIVHNIKCTVVGNHGEKIYVN
eukprot:Clim_evm13s172 gene=Clim_evmTU13s172